MKLPDKPVTQWTGSDIVEMLKSLDRKTWTKIGIISSVSLLLIIFYLWPAWVGRGLNKRQIMERKGMIQKIENLEKQRPYLTEENGEIGEFISKTKNGLYTAQEAPLLLGVISRLAQESGVTIVASNPQQTKEAFPKPFNETYDASYYNYVLEGGYHEIAQFVSRVESSPKSLRIQKFSIRADNADPYKQIADMVMFAGTLKVQEAS